MSSHSHALQRQQNIARAQLEKAGEERKMLENLLEQNVHALVRFTLLPTHRKNEGQYYLQKKTQGDLAETKASIKLLESSTVNDTEKTELRAQLADLQVCIVKAPTHYVF
jgi:hypothetical protein